jgi:hypothetical protein
MEDMKKKRDQERQQGKLVHKRREREENREQKVNEIKKQSKMGNTVK